MLPQQQPINQQQHQATSRRIQVIQSHMSQQQQQQQQHIESSSTASSSSTKISLSSHVLETGRMGKPYNQMKITLHSRRSEHEPEVQLAEGVTNANGRVTMADWKWLQSGVPNVSNDIYRLRFHIAESGYDCMYPYADIHFTMKPDGHYHIPLTLNPYGYSTYKGS